MAKIYRNRATATLAEALAGDNRHRVMTPERVKDYVGAFGIGEVLEGSAETVDQTEAAKTGVYGRLNATALEGAPYNADWVWLLMNRGSRPVQMAVDYEQERWFIRSRRLGGWEGWKEIYHTGNLPEKTRIAVITGEVANGGTIPIPSGYSESQCRFFWFARWVQSDNGDDYGEAGTTRVTGGGSNNFSYCRYIVIGTQWG